MAAKMTAILDDVTGPQQRRKLQHTPHLVKHIAVIQQYYSKNPRGVPTLSCTTAEV